MTVKSFVKRRSHALLRLGSIPATLWGRRKKERGLISRTAAGNRALKRLAQHNYVTQPSP